MANIPEEALLALAVKNKGGGGGTTNYNDLDNQPQIGGVTLTGNKSASDLGLADDTTVQGILNGQSLDSFSDVETALAGKVDKVNGKGLSTNDYTDADKAIVGGVTAALADKADKSAVKNEFIGTTAEWNALTVEQRKAYDTYQIKGDYTEGSGGLPDYSTTEQKTGQKWIDGKDIYVKVYAFDNTNNATVTIQTTGIDILIDSKVVSAAGNAVQLNYPYYSDNGDKLRWYLNENKELIIMRGDYPIINGYIVLWYTKTT